MQRPSGLAGEERKRAFGKAGGGFSTSRPVSDSANGGESGGQNPRGQHFTAVGGDPGKVFSKEGLTPPRLQLCNPDSFTFPQPGPQRNLYIPVPAISQDSPLDRLTATCL